MRAETNQSLEPDYDPNAGGVGFLTLDEYDRLTRAVNAARKHVPWWRVAGHIRLGDQDEQHNRSSDPTIPLPATWLAAEEIGNLLGELNHLSLEDAAKRMPEIAMQLVREVETALAKWPMEDKPHKVRYLRCRVCQQQTLKYYPPRSEGDDITVKCADRDCRAVEDPNLFARDALLIAKEAERVAGKRLDSAGRGTVAGRPLTFNDLPVDIGGQGEDDSAETEAVVIHP